MAIWVPFVQLALNAKKKQEEAIKSQGVSEERIGQLTSEIEGLGKEEEGLHLQLADLRKPREYRPINTRKGAYNRYLRGR